MSRKIFTYFQWGVETNSAKIQNHNTVQGYNSEENPFKIILFVCFRRILVRSTTCGSHPASRGRSWIPLGNWRHIVSGEQFLTSTFQPARFHLFSHQLKFFWGTPGPGALAPATPRPSRWAWGYPMMKKIRTYVYSFDMIHERKKIAVFTYRSPHFWFLWRRPCDYHAICCMEGKTIQWLPNPSPHVPIYLQ